MLTRASGVRDLSKDMEKDCMLMSLTKGGVEIRDWLHWSCVQSMSWQFPEMYFPTKLKQHCIFQALFYELLYFIYCIITGMLAVFELDKTRLGAGSL